MLAIISFLFQLHSCFPYGDTNSLLLAKISRCKLSPVTLSFYGESLGGRGFVTVLATIALQAPLDRARGELPSDTRTLISHWEKFRGKTGEIWRSVIAT